MSTIDPNSILSVSSYEPSYWTPSSSDSQSDSEESQDSYVQEETLFASSVDQAISAGIYDIKNIIEPDHYEPTSTTTSTSSSSTSDDSSSSDTSSIIDTVMASIESSTMSILASMTPSDSGVDVLGYMYAKNGLMSSSSLSTFELTA